ncbi:MAG: hypothetical protein ACI9F9_001698 [Candidatus Paceibacteria bacterium]|jgi:hypothetical protein
MSTTTEPSTEFFLPLLQAAQGLDLRAPDQARVELERRYPASGAAASMFSEVLQGWFEEGKICERGEMPMRFGRVSKATPESLDFSIDIVHMDGPGPEHKHPQGEVNFCISIDGQPTFDGHAPGWVVFPPNSVHVPTVSGGTMLIVYLLPQGAMEFTRTK